MERVACIPCDSSSISLSDHHLTTNSGHLRKFKTAARRATSLFTMQLSTAFPQNANINIAKVDVAADIKT